MSEVNNIEATDPKIKVKLGEYEFDIVFNFGTIRRIKKLTGLVATDPSFFTDYGPEQLHAVTWACITKKYPNITENDVDDLISLDKDNIQQINRAIMAAFRLAEPEPKKKYKKLKDLKPQE